MDGILLSEHVSIAARSQICTYESRLRLSMALELAKHNPVYEDIASKFFEVGWVPSSFDNDNLSCYRSTSSSSRMP